METENNIPEGEDISFSNHTIVNSEIKIVKIKRNWMYIDEFILKKDHSNEKHVERVIKVNGRLKLTTIFMQMK